MLVECEDCKQKFEVDKQITHKKKYEIERQSIFLTYYDCPSCGRCHFVQIDDEASLRMLREATSQFAKLAAKRKQGKEIPKKQSDKFSKTRKHLANYRMNLMRKYVNKSVYDYETGFDFVLRFSI